MVCEISLPRQPRRCLNADVLQLDARPSFVSMATMSHAPQSTRTEPPRTREERSFIALKDQCLN
jgi:hypothetical protein